MHCIEKLKIKEVEGEEEQVSPAKVSLIVDSVIGMKRNVSDVMEQAILLETEIVRFTIVHAESVQKWDILQNAVKQKTAPTKLPQQQEGIPITGYQLSKRGGEYLRIYSE